MHQCDPCEQYHICTQLNAGNDVYLALVVSGFVSLTTNRFAFETCPDGNLPLPGTAQLLQKIMD